MVTITRTKQQIRESRKILLKKNDKAYAARFHAESDLLNTDNLFCTFTEQVRARISGKIEPMPSSTFYVFDLKNFLPTPSERNECGESRDHIVAFNRKLLARDR